MEVGLTMIIRLIAFRVGGGEFGGIVKWIGEAAHLDQHADPEDRKEFCRLVNKMAPHVSYERLKFIASIVWVEATKA